MKKRFELRRATSRAIEVITSYWDEPVRFTTSDISPGGAFIKSSLIPEMGDYVVCSFELGKNKQYDFFGKVVRTNLTRRITDSATSGFGIEFLDTTPWQRIQMRDSLKGTPPPIPSMPRLPTGKKGGTKKRS